ncbi:MAG: GFA family protein [Pseudomonadota bacterium]
MSDVLTGQCLYGAVRFTVKPEVAADGIHLDACHCSMCRRLVGSALMGLNLLEAPKVEDDTHLTSYASSDRATRQFCAVCGSNLFYQLNDGSLFTVIAGALDDIPDAWFAKEIFIDEKPDYYDFAQPTYKMTGAEVLAAFAGNGQEG